MVNRSRLAAVVVVMLALPAFARSHSSTHPKAKHKPAHHAKHRTSHHKPVAK
jgi:hypothetical protein